MTFLYHPASSQASDLRQEAVARAQDLMRTLPIPAGAALAATGSLARGEMTPRSDLDLIVLHPKDMSISERQAEAIWHPIWEAKFRLDYAVRSPQDNADLMSSGAHDAATAALALLDIAPLAGDTDLVAEARALVLTVWRRQLPRTFTQVMDKAVARWRRSGSLVTMTHPDLKHGRGGLRDIELLRALALANLCDLPDLSPQRALLLDTRTLLHEQARRPRDVLDPEFAADIALALGFEDRYALSRMIAAAARDIDRALARGLAQARGLLTSSRPRGREVRRPLDIDVVESGGQVALARHPNLTDPALLLRVASAAARTGYPIAESTWTALSELPALPERLPRAAVADFFTLLASPEHSAEVINALDAHGLWASLVPEWEHARGRIPKEPTHISTVDQHSLNTVARCAEATVTVARPDLLLLAALYHDLGKGYGRPHEPLGAEFVVRMAARLGLSLRERACVQTVVAEHSVIARIAATCDPTSDEALHLLLDAVRYDLLTVELLGALTQADAEATGPGVWTTRLARARDLLVRRARQELVAAGPTRPLINVPGPIGLRPAEGGDPNTAVVYWRGNYQREIIRVLAVFAAKAINIDLARLITEPAGTVAAEFQIRATVAAALDPDNLVQTYKSGVHSTLPRPKPAATATYWRGNVLEVRTGDRIAALGALLAVLPPLAWLQVTRVGATMIAQAAFSPDTLASLDRAEAERQVAVALGES